MIKDRTKMETKDSRKMVTSSLADPDHFDTDPDSSVHFGSESDFMTRIRILTVSKR